MKKLSSCTLYVSGMHCPACEVLLNKKISKIEGVQDVRASLSDSKVEVTYKKGHVPHVDDLNSRFADLGYTFTNHPLGQAKFGQLQIIQAIVVGIIGILAFFIIDDTKILSKFTLSNQSSLPAFFAIGVIASLSSCAALVGGVLLSMSKQWVSLYGGKNENKRTLPFVLFNIGRLVSFTVLGGFLGLLGSFFQLSLKTTSFLVIAVSVIMAILGLQMLGFSWAKKIKFGFPKFLSKFSADEQNFKGKYMPFSVGAMTFFLPCGFTLMAQTIALATGNYLTSALMMLAFALGTLPMLSTISFSSIKFQKNASFSGTFNLIAGLFILVFGVFNVNSQLNVLGAPSLSDLFRGVPPVFANSNSVEIIGQGKDQYQAVTMRAEEFGYYPESLTLKADIPTKLTVNNKDVVGCAQAMWLGGLYDKVVYLNTRQATAEFTPKKGRYKISCTMGMVRPVIVEVI